MKNNDRHKTFDEIVNIIKSANPDRVKQLYTKKVILFSDIDGFTSIVHDRGIEYFMLLVYEAKEILRHTIHKYGARLVKIDGDSFILVCDSVEKGIEMILEYRKRLSENESTKHLSVNWGIGYGDIIELEDDAFGLELNLSAKIGEDVAKNGQILVTAAAVKELDKKKYQLTKHNQFGFDYYEVTI